MINYLKGELIDTIKNPNLRVIAIIEVNGIGYEVQIPSRLARELALKSQEKAKVFTYQLIRDDRPVLYGFGTGAERDLFVQLLSVSGVGAQLAVALIDSLGLTELVQAIVMGNTRLLTKTPGVGQKTADRIALELKTKLALWRKETKLDLTSIAFPSPTIIEDVEMTLLALGYDDREIQQALSTLSQDSLMLKNPKAEDWIRSAITWLSQT